MSEQLIVRGLPDGLKATLREAAQARGCSMEQVARELLVSASGFESQPSPVADWVHGVARLDLGDDFVVPERGVSRDFAFADESGAADR